MLLIDFLSLYLQNIFLHWKIYASILKQVNSINQQLLIRFKIRLTQNFTLQTYCKKQASSKIEQFARNKNPQKICLIGRNINYSFSKEIHANLPIMTTKLSTLNQTNLLFFEKKFCRLQRYNSL